MAPYTSEIGAQVATSVLAKVFRSIRMEVCTRATGRTISHTTTVASFTKTERCTKESGSMTSHTALGLSIISMAPSIGDFGKMTCKMDVGWSAGLMGASFLVITLKVPSMGMASSLGPMETNTMASSSRTESREKDANSGVTGAYTRVFGSTIRCTVMESRHGQTASATRGTITRTKRTVKAHTTGK